MTTLLFAHTQRKKSEKYATEFQSQVGWHVLRFVMIRCRIGNFFILACAATSSTHFLPFFQKKNLQRYV